MTYSIATEALPPPLANLCVLIVEDMPDELRMLARFLGDAGARVLMAVQGGEAMRLAQLMRPDVVLLDVQLPPPNGFAVCRELQDHPETLNIPVLFVSGMLEEEAKLEGFAAGGRDFITKPFTEAELVARVALHANLGRRLGSVHKESTTPRWLTVVLQRLQASLAETPDLEKLALEAGTTVHRLKDAFRTQMHTTPAAFVRESRLKEAAWQMSETSKSVADVGAALGYSSPANFATAFRERFGISPLQYRLGRHTFSEQPIGLGE
ncbi:MAG: response regulator [Rhodoferax sp.]|uniref:response regulator n=1 Tax=Rhodoferax sp. TaxID=50421 RepID=UPI0030189640